MYMYGIDMEKLTLTTLRHKLFEVADRVIETGVPVAIARRGKTLLLVPQAPSSRLSRLKRRKLIKGSAEALVDVKAAKWLEARNLG
jgi:prevent-host-death family protein